MMNTSLVISIISLRTTLRNGTSRELHFFLNGEIILHKIALEYNLKHLWQEHTYFLFLHHF